jgi:sterol desaturase/sphingolipid hydroxylase (fatty acid hydroxylase superfamily)
MVSIPHWSPAVAAAVALALLWIGEGLFPLVMLRGMSLRRRLLNLGAGSLGYGVAAIVLSGLTFAVTSWTAATEFGVLRWTDWSWWIEWPIALVVLDLWAYAWHVWCHNWRFLWRFHLVHHHDEQVDVTTSMRFHVGEIIGKGLLTLPVIALAGASISQVLVVESITVVVVVFHHANLRLPRWLELPMRSVIVTPAMHVVHHSRWQPETNSNYGAVFSLWDRVFGTFRLRRDPTKIDFGIDGYSGRAVQTFLGLLATPFRPITSRYGATPREFLDGTEKSRASDPVQRPEAPLVEPKPQPVGREQRVHERA